MRREAGRTGDRQQRRGSSARNTGPGGFAGRRGGARGSAPDRRGFRSGDTGGTRNSYRAADGEGNGRGYRRTEGEGSARGYRRAEGEGSARGYRRAEGEGSARGYRRAEGEGSARGYRRADEDGTRRSERTAGGRPNFRAGSRGDAAGRGGFRANRGGRPVRTGARAAEAVTPQNEATQAVESTSPNLVMGRHPVLEALKAGRPINKILVSEASEGGSLLEILGKARAAGIVVQTVKKTFLSRLAGGSHQGIVAYVAPHAYAELDDVLARKTGQPPLVVLLDEVSDPHNLGAVLRTAEATAAQGVVIPKRRAVPLTETVAKASAGAVEYVPVARVSNLVQAMERLKEAGYWIVGTDVEGQSDYTEVDYKGPVAVVIGAEGKGLSRLVKEHCDFLVKLPMLGKLQSLNASVAAGVILYEIVRQRS